MSSAAGADVRKERHSANPKSSVRAPPKKDGAGGRFTFGRATDPNSQEGSAALDAGDPNYEIEDNTVGNLCEEPAGNATAHLPSLRPGLSAARKRWLPESLGHHLAFQGADVKCLRCHKGLPYVFSICKACQLCAKCCVSKAASYCPALANGGPLHQHPLRAVESHGGCAVAGPNCIKGTGFGWACTVAGCEFFACDRCMASPPPESFVSTGRRHREAPEEVEAAGASYDVGQAELRAAAEWEMRHAEQSDQEAFVGMGSLQSRPPKGKGFGKGLADRGVRSASTQVPPAPALDRHLSDASRKALRHFAVIGGANADVATAEELLAQGSAPGRLKDEERDQLREAVTAGEIGVAAQFLMGARLARVEADAGQSSEGETCPLCFESIAKARAEGALVGCLNGHGLHAACAADLALGGALCPACRAPLFYANVGDAKSSHFFSKFENKAEFNKSCNFNVGDIVLVHPDVARCSYIQELPDSCGWNKDMVSACGTEGVVVELVVGPDGLQHVEVKHDRTPAGGFTWRWHSILLVFVNAPTASRKNGETATDAADSEEGEQDATQVGEKLVQQLREELAMLKKAREEVRTSTAGALGIASPDQPEVAPAPAPPLLSRTFTHGSAQAVLDLRMTVAPVDVQRAKHLLSLARQWGDSDAARKRRAKLHDSVRAGDLDSVARVIRQYNTAARVQHALWLDADRPTSRYRVSFSARVELVAQPLLGSPRTGFVLLPGSEFASSREVLDAKDGHWLRVGDPKMVVNEYQEGMSERRAGTRVDMSDMPDSIGARVMRGPDWVNTEYENGDADGGVGSAGTLIGFGSPPHEFIKVRWDHDGSEKEYWAGAVKNLWEIAFANSKVFPPGPQGWLCVRPLGPGGPPIVSEIHDMLRCFKCGGGMPEPSKARGFFEQVKPSDVKKGDEVLVAATMEPAVVEKVVHRPGLPDLEPLVLCRFASSVEAELRYDSKGRTDDEADLFAFRPDDLVRQDSAWATKSKCGEGASDIILHKGLIRSRREFIMMVGSVEGARAQWSETEDPPDNYASCIRGHYLHARCFQDCLFSGSGCPICQEPLFVPGVQREGPVDPAACCGRPANDGVEIEVEPEAAQEETAEHIDVEQVLGHTNNLRMCPLCYTGPLINENCNDMRNHHGQCPTCGRKPFTDEAIAAAVVRSGTLQGSIQLPRCDQCNVAIFFNGCRECGYLFTGRSWTDLPLWDPKARDELHTSQRYLRAVRLLADQVRAEAAHLAHEQAALDEVSKGIETVNLDFNEKPPTCSGSLQAKKSESR